MQFNYQASLTKILLLISFVLLAVLANWPIVSFNMMYIEQATIYNANQSIHSLADLIHVYTHPQMLDFLVPFFRPSGHFLMYQLLTPFLGWYNTKALFIVNLLFLGLTGYVMAKLYEKLFPGYVIGGCLAFSLYMMNPALMISKLTIMHFEFAYVFFVSLSLYHFVIFCQKNQTAENQLPKKFQHHRWLVSALFFYIVAVTFKEPALMLAPVLATYFLLTFYQPGQIIKLIKNRNVIVTIILLKVTCISLGIYLTMNWQHGMHPLLDLVTYKRISDTAHQFIVYFFSLTHNYIPPKANDPLMRLAITPAVTHYIIWSALLITAISLINLFRRNNLLYQKSVIFLFLCLILFMLLPLWWGMGYGWHLSLSLLCEAMILGFGIEFYARHFLGKSWVIVAGSILTLAISLSTYKVDNANITYLNGTQSSFIAQLDYNAVFHAPLIKTKLNDATILVVQDNMHIGDYNLGNSTYPLLLYAKGDNINFDTYFNVDQRKIFWQVKPVYSGNLFHWAYNLPKLKEEVISFSDGDLKLVPNAVLSSWIRHLNNIVCVTYDKSGNWFDNTTIFKKNILTEQAHRHIQVKPYNIQTATALHSVAVALKKLPYADPELCQTICDNTKHCKGFTYTHASEKGKTLAQCYFYNKIAIDKKHCSSCEAYVVKLL
jgi:hypothetical protein